MADDQAQDKTEQATPKKIEEAKEKGNVAKSQDLNSVALLFAGIFGISYSAQKILEAFTDMAMTIYSNSSNIQLSTDTVSFYVGKFIEVFVYIIGPIMLALGIAALVINYVQIGFIFAKKALIPKFEKINPAKGIKNLFSTTKLVDLAKGIVKIALVSYVGLYVIREHLEEFPLLAFGSVATTMSYLGDILFELTTKIGLLLIVLGVADFAYQRYDHNEKLKMSKQEVREESKQYEGNPQMKGKIKQAMRQAARARMLQLVPDATVVITNPTFLAIAIQYNPVAKSDAPKVLAKGKRKLAQKIKEIARKHDVPVIENKSLTRALYNYAQPGSEIPVIFYEAIAEILAEVFKRNKGKTPGVAA